MHPRRSSAMIALVALVALAALAAACGTAPAPPRAGGSTHAEPAPPRPAPALPLDRIAIVGASVSAGFGGAPFGEAFAAAAPRSQVESFANLMLFRDPIGDSRLQIDRAIAFRPTALFAIDFLFWDVYGSPDPSWRERALTSALAELDRAYAAGAWLVLGDIPYITTAAEWMLARDHVPDPAALAAFDDRIAAWAASRDRVLLVPFASWTTPLLGNDDVELAPGEHLPARSLLSIDGLHANPLGTWYLLDKLDRFIESRLPGTPAGALAFQRPAP
jgi:hypothetical protein